MPLRNSAVRIRFVLLSWRIKKRKKHAYRKNNSAPGDWCFGAGLERNVKEIFDLETALAAKLKEILK